jgi:hypothetical protein
MKYGAGLEAWLKRWITCLAVQSTEFTPQYYQKNKIGGRYAKSDARPVPDQPGEKQAVSTTNV